jgi:DNA-directed RNA polymerase subunit RPC12/RpoP
MIIGMGRCLATGKVIFGNQRVANRAVSRAATRGELPPMRHYQCPTCGYWHLARKRRPAGKRDNA